MTSSGLTKTQFGLKFIISYLQVRKPSLKDIKRLRRKREARTKPASVTVGLAPRDWVHQLSSTGEENIQLTHGWAVGCGAGMVVVKLRGHNSEISSSQKLLKRRIYLKDDAAPSLSLWEEVKSETLSSFGEEQHGGAFVQVGGATSPKLPGTASLRLPFFCLFLRFCFRWTFLSF